MEYDNAEDTYETMGEMDPSNGNAYYKGLEATPGRAKVSYWDVTSMLELGFLRNGTKPSVYFQIIGSRRWTERYDDLFSLQGKTIGSQITVTTYIIKY